MSDADNSLPQLYAFSTSADVDPRLVIQRLMRGIFQGNDGGGAGGANAPSAVPFLTALAPQPPLRPVLNPAQALLSEDSGGNGGGSGIDPNLVTAPPNLKGADVALALSALWDARSSLLNAADRDGRTPLWWACKRGMRAAAFDMLRRGAHVCGVTDTTDGRNLCHVTRDVAILEALLDVTRRTEGDVGVRTLLAARTTGANALGGCTPLHVAAIKGGAARVRCLVRHGALVNETTSTGATPLHLCAASQPASRNMGVMAALMACGADWRAELTDGHNVLSSLISTPRKEVQLRELLACAPSPQLVNVGCTAHGGAGVTPLTTLLDGVSIQHEHVSRYVKVLLRHGARMCVDDDEEDRRRMRVALAQSRAHVNPMLSVVLGTWLSCHDLCPSPPPSSQPVSPPPATSSSNPTRVCVICMTSEARVANVPCGHVCTCVACNGWINDGASVTREEASSCVICRASVRDRIVLY